MTELKPITQADIVKRRHKTKKKDSEFFGVFDLETNRWVNFRMAGFFDGTQFNHFLNLEDMCAHIFSYEKTFNVYAHFGGGFDFLFLLQSIFAGETYTVRKIIPRGSGSVLLCFQVFRKLDPTVQINFIDSNAILPFSLSDLCKKFSPQNKKDSSFDSALIDEVTPEVIEYCKLDCISLWEIIDKFRKSSLIEPTGMKLTVASQAMATFQTYLKSPIQSLYLHTKLEHFKEPYQKEKSLAHTFKYDWWIRGNRNAPLVLSNQLQSVNIEPAYFGGRTEVFTPHFKAPPFLYYYDFNSMYPGVMRDNIFPHRPIGLYINTKKSPLIFNSEWHGFWDVDVSVPHMFAPPLGIIHRKLATGKYIFPTGTFRGKWSAPELNYALSIGCEITKVHECLRMDTCGKIFTEFVDDMYKIRQTSTDSIDKELAKLILNSSYGRFALNPMRESIEIDRFFEDTRPIKLQMPETISEKTNDKTVINLVDTENKQIEFCSVPEMSHTFSNVAIGAYITSYARIELHKSLRACGEDLYYCDTDSFFTTKKLPVSSTLGDIKLEKTISSAAFILPKAYAAMVLESPELGFESPQKVHVRLKGLDERKTRHLLPEQMLEQFRGSYEIERAKMRHASKAEISEMISTNTTISTETYDEKHFEKDEADYAENPEAYLLKNHGKKPQKMGKGIHKLTESMLFRFGKFVERKPVLTRRIQSAYDKRRVYIKADGTFATEAWHLKNGVIDDESYRVIGSHANKKSNEKRRAGA